MGRGRSHGGAEQMRRSRVGQAQATSRLSRGRKNIPPPQSTSAQYSVLSPPPAKMRRRAAKRAHKATEVPDSSLSADFEISLAEALEVAAPSFATVDTLSNDRRRLYQHALPVPSSGSQSPAPQPGLALSPPGVGDPEDWDPFFLPQAPETFHGEYGEAEEPAEIGEKASRYDTSVCSQSRIWF